jgi:hypothetical protein
LKIKFAAFVVQIWRRKKMEIKIKDAGHALTELKNLVEGRRTEFISKKGHKIFITVFAGTYKIEGVQPGDVSLTKSIEEAGIRLSY